MYSEWLPRLYPSVMILHVQTKILGSIVLCAAALCPSVALPQVGGNLAAGPPLDLTLKVTAGPDGTLLSQGEWQLITGEYYRLNVMSDSEVDWRLDVDELLRNSHLRIVTISGIEVHLQGLSFRAIEFDVPGTAQFSFTPIRPGTYPFSVSDVPSTVRRRSAEAGRPVEPRSIRGQFVVE